MEGKHGRRRGEVKRGQRGKKWKVGKDRNLHEVRLNVIAIISFWGNKELS